MPRHGRHDVVVVEGVRGGAVDQCGHSGADALAGPDERRVPGGRLGQDLGAQQAGDRLRAARERHAEPVEKALGGQPHDIGRQIVERGGVPAPREFGSDRHPAGRKIDFTFS